MSCLHDGNDHLPLSNSDRPQCRWGRCTTSPLRKTTSWGLVPVTSSRCWIAQTVLGGKAGCGGRVGCFLQTTQYRYEERHRGRGFSSTPICRREQSSSGVSESNTQLCTAVDCGFIDTWLPSVACSGFIERLILGGDRHTCRMVSEEEVLQMPHFFFFFLSLQQMY